jgi:hypothetical protein|tara:strand:- start:588 stop:917 length:330 start_codon:yes stop_codon:yes gene_type:complete
MDKIYIKLIPNQDKQEGDNRPSWVAPINPKSPAGKTWRIGASINGTWYNQCAFDDTAEDGTPTGGINVVLTPNDGSSQSSAGGGGKPAFAPQKTFAKRPAYGNNRPSRY